MATMMGGRVYFVILVIIVSTMIITAFRRN